MIVNRQRSVHLARRPLEKFLSRVREELGLGEAGVTVCLVSEAEIARMNETFRKKKGPTDVLSFPSGEKRRRGGARGAARKGKIKKRNTEVIEGAERTENPRNNAESDATYLGDIAIAPRTARRYARKHGRSLQEELRVLMLHGVLHLLGYDHETDQGQMDRFEKRLRKRLGLA
jgi:probable rRNA maturation factor